MIVCCVVHECVCACMFVCMHAFVCGVWMGMRAFCFYTNASVLKDTRVDEHASQNRHISWQNRSRGCSSRLMALAEA